MIWDQIQIQYATILRAQRIMFVQDKDDTAKELKRQNTFIIKMRTKMAI